MILGLLHFFFLEEFNLAFGKWYLLIFGHLKPTSLGVFVHACISLVQQWLTNRCATALHLPGGGGGLGTGCPCVAQASDFFNEAFSFFSWSKREKSRFYRNFSEGDHYVLLDKSRILVVRDFKFISYEIAIAWWGQVRGRMTWDNRNKRLTPGVGVLCENHRRSTGEFSL